MHPSNMNIVHTVNVVHLRAVTSPDGRHLAPVPDDRRALARHRKRQQILDATTQVIDEHGLDGITMQRVADQLDWAVGTLYRYFPSKAALRAGLQQEAVDILRRSLQRATRRWEEYLASEVTDDAALAAMVRLEAFGAFVAAATVVYADEFELLRQLLSTPVPFDARDEAEEALALVKRFLEPATELLDAAVTLDLLEPGDRLERAVVWITALHGVLLTERLTSLDRHLFRPAHLARALTLDLLTGWGADRAEVEVAADHVERLAALGPMAPPLDDPDL